MKDGVLVIVVGAVFHEILARLRDLITKELNVQLAKTSRQTHVSFFAQLGHSTPSDLVFFNNGRLLSGNNLHDSRC